MLAAATCLSGGGECGMSASLNQLRGGVGGGVEIRIEFIPINLNIACGNVKITQGIK
jgi:hypothetical protein